jgi:hypothetical protein
MLIDEKIEEEVPLSVDNISAISTLQIRDPRPLAFDC